jgi:tRNA(Arg) A34 adenosine deaminase TadA
MWWMRWQRAEAVKQGSAHAEFQAIGAACKRMRNILKQAEEKGITPAAKFEGLCRLRSGRNGPLAAYVNNGA